MCVREVNHPKYPSVLQALEIEDPVVANCLIDQRGIECILLIKVNTLTHSLTHSQTQTQGPTARGLCLGIFSSKTISYHFPH